MMKATACFTLGAVAFALFSAPSAAARTNAPRVPTYCQHLDDLGNVLTIEWNEEGCHADRDAFALRIVDHQNHPGWYPPLTCHRGAAVYDWPSPACAHARNLYARGKVRAIYFGRPPHRS